MNPKLILLMAVLLAGALSFSSLILPGPAASLYTAIMQPLTLFLGFALALRVAFRYKKDLKKSFLFLSLFLLLYALANIHILWVFLYASLGSLTTTIILLLQVTDYAMLLASCVYTLRVIEVKALNRYGWALLGLVFALGVYVVAYEAPALESLSAIPLVALSRLMIRVVDMAVVLMLIPVLLLYLQHSRAKAQESVTFAFIMGGLILSITSTYILQLVLGVSLDTMAREYFQKGSLLDAIYIFGYLLIAAGLYAHSKYDEWGFKAVERALLG
ncbi:MAG: hypothetical protein HY687_05270 [Chloroflexi bacterium]|nr:hypothetical protein [Chloroflexota bacterium]